jgi:chemotaxis protein CheX
MSTEISAEIVAQIVESIFSTMMGTEVSHCDTPWLSAGDRLTSSVFLEGEWNGAVSLECTQRQACQFAGEFLSMDPPGAVDDDVRDVLGELVNMIGGNLKSAIADRTQLSMPSVVDGSNYELHLCGSGPRQSIAFEFNGGHFWVTVVAKDCKSSSVDSIKLPGFPLAESLQTVDK